MSKVTMPEAVACLWIRDGSVVNAFAHTPNLKEGDQLSEYFAEQGFAEEPLITTTQAEAYADARVREALEALNNQAQELYESSLKSRFARDGAADEDELKAIDLWNVESVGMAKAYTNMQKAIRALIPPTKNEAEE